MPNVTDQLEPWPEELRLRPGGRELVVSFDNGEIFTFSAEFLRVESPSAEVKGHAPGQEITVPGKRNVAITRIEPVGNYAVRLIFSDGHATGLFSWTYLSSIGHNQDELWQKYLEALKQKGLSRD